MRLGLTFLTLFLSSLVGFSTHADSAKSRCDIYKSGSDKAEKMIACTFSQRSGYISINRSDGIVHELSPTGGNSGEFIDQYSSTVYRQSGLGDQGIIFRFPDESVYVYWNTDALDPESKSATFPFTTDDYDATTLLRCREVGQKDFATCPAGILRMEDKQASIVVVGLTGEQFTINFMKDYINATNREVKAELDGDTWTVVINGREVYQVPLAAIEGG